MEMSLRESEKQNRFLSLKLLTPHLSGSLHQCCETRPGKDRFRKDG
jgi:hypothetical protein